MSDSPKRYRLDLRPNGEWDLVPLQPVTSTVLDSILDPSPPEWLSVIMNAAKVGGFGKPFPESGLVVVYFTTDQDHNLIAFTNWRGEPSA